MAANKQSAGIPLGDLATAGSLEGRNRARFLTIRMEALARMKFSGLLTVTPTQGSRWGLYFREGQLAWGVGGAFPQRRWQRLMRLHCPQLKIEDLTWVQMATPMEGYVALLDLLRRQRITLEQAQAVIAFTLAEVLFDILQEASESLTYSCAGDQILPAADLLPQQSLDAMWKQVQTEWLSWQQVGLRECSPNGIPKIAQPDALKTQVPERVYLTLSKVINGQRSLRDLAILMKQELAPLAQSLLGFIRQGVIQLQLGTDLDPIQSRPSQTAQPQPVPTTSGLKIACIDDSPYVCEQMKQVLTAMGYQFLGIQDSTQALAALITFKPDLIFLDLVMPVASGYEVCAQIRRMSRFKMTPVVILTGHDGMVDRVRAKLAGSTDFVTKPIDPEQVREIISKHTQSSGTRSTPTRTATRSPSGMAVQVSPAI